MTAMVELTPEEIAEIKALTNQSDAGAAIRAAMREYLRHARRQQLKALSGRVEMQDNWRELEEAELRAADEARNYVLIDTCIWVSFFNRPQSPTKQAVNQLLDEDRAALAGPIVTEILCGFRRDVEADWAASVLRGVTFFEATWDDWRGAARLGRQVAARGHLLPVSDLALAAVALRYGCAVYSTDPHFDLVPDLKRYSRET